MSKEHTTEHLRAELKSLSDTLEEVLSSSGEKSKEELSKIRSKAEQALKQSRYRLGETGDAIAKQTRVAAARADEYVRENPWTGVGIGAAIGCSPFSGSIGMSTCRMNFWQTAVLLISLLISRNGTERKRWRCL